MLLRVTSDDPEARPATTPDDAPDTVENAAELGALAVAVVGGIEADIRLARANLIGALGPAAVGDAAGIIARFAAFDLIADATGTRLDEDLDAIGENIRRKTFGRG